MQILKLLVAMCAIVSAQHDSSKCNSGSTGTEPCCYDLDPFGDETNDGFCNDGYDVERIGYCTSEESGSDNFISWDKYECYPPLVWDSDVDETVGFFGGLIIRWILLWIVVPIVVCICICVAVCACSKTCCFAQK